jgi:hypothetical protein
LKIVCSDPSWIANVVDHFLGGSLNFWKELNRRGSIANNGYSLTCPIIRLIPRLNVSNYCYECR